MKQERTISVPSISLWNLLATDGQQLFRDQIGNLVGMGRSSLKKMDHPANKSRMAQGDSDQDLGGGKRQE